MALTAPKNSLRLPRISLLQRSPISPTRPFAAGDSSANIPLYTAGRRVMIRWVARRSGLLQTLYLRVRTAGATGCSDDPGVGYGGGDGGSWIVTTTRVLENGAPNRHRRLASSMLYPCHDKSFDSMAIHLGIRVRAGREYATVVRNGVSDPSRNFSSVNFLHARRGLVGANAKNRPRDLAQESYYGLDPREAVGFSTNAGRSWRIPGGPYGVHHGAVFIPTFVEAFARGRAAGQPYYSSTPVLGPVSMSLRMTRSGSIAGLGAYTSGYGAAPVVIRVNRRPREVAILRGRGFLRARIRPIRVHRGDAVVVTTLAGPGGLGLRREYAGAIESGLVGLGIHSLDFLGSDPSSVVPIYPLGTAGAQIYSLPGQ